MGNGRHNTLLKLCNGRHAEKHAYRVRHDRTPYMARPASMEVCCLHVQKLSQIPTLFHSHFSVRGIALIGERNLHPMRFTLGQLLLHFVDINLEKSGLFTNFR